MLKAALVRDYYFIKDVHAKVTEFSRIGGVLSEFTNLQSFPDN